MRLLNQVSSPGSMNTSLLSLISGDLSSSHGGCGGTHDDTNSSSAAVAVDAVVGGILDFFPL